MFLWQNLETSWFLMQNLEFFTFSHQIIKKHSFCAKTLKFHGFVIVGYAKVKNVLKSSDSVRLVYLHLG